MTAVIVGELDGGGTLADYYSVAVLVVNGGGSLGVNRVRLGNVFVAFLYPCYVRENKAGD